MVCHAGIWTVMASRMHQKIEIMIASGMPPTARDYRAKLVLQAQPVLKVRKVLQVLPDPLVLPGFKVRQALRARLVLKACKEKWDLPVLPDLRDPWDRKDPREACLFLVRTA
jgi:hypothetical protein